MVAQATLTPWHAVLIIVGTLVLALTPLKLLKQRVTGRRFKPLNQPYRFAKSQNGYCLTFDLSIAIQPEPARPCGVPGILFKLR
jgi:hypothetical protein